jgi:hypothetical protein
MVGKFEESGTFPGEGMYYGGWAPFPGPVGSRESFMDLTIYAGEVRPENPTVR